MTIIMVTNEVITNSIVIDENNMVNNNLWEFYKEWKASKNLIKICQKWQLHIHDKKKKKKNFSIICQKMARIKIN